MSTHVRIWSLSWDDDNDAGGAVFVSESAVLQWIWSTYGDHNDQKTDDQIRVWIEEYAEKNDDQIPGNVGWEPVDMPLDQLERIEK